MENDALALGGNARRIFRHKGQFEFVGMRRHHFADFRGAQKGGVAHRQHAGIGHGRLRRVDRPETAIQPAFEHPRQINLREIFLIAVTLHDVPAGTRQAGRGIKMGVEADQLLMQRHGGFADGRDRLRIGRQRQKSRGRTAQQHIAP